LTSRTGLIIGAATTERNGDCLITYGSWHGQDAPVVAE